MLVPQPAPDDVGVHEVAAAYLAPGEKVTVTLKPETSGNLHRIFSVPMSRHANATYEVVIDGTTRFGPAPSPPTEVDDLGVTFVPTLRLQRSMELIIRDTRTTGNERPYLMHVLGWEA